MFFLVALCIMMSVYVIKNEKIQSKSKTGFLAVEGIVLAIWIFLSIIG